MVSFRMLVDELYECTKEDGKCFTGTSGGIHQAAFAVDDVLPGFLLIRKRREPIRCQPLFNDAVACCVYEIVQHLYYFLLIDVRAVAAC